MKKCMILMGLLLLLGAFISTSSAEKLDRPALVELMDQYLAALVKHDPSTLARLGEMDELSRINTLFKTHPGFRAPGSFVANLRELVNSDHFQVLRSDWSVR